MQHNGSLTQMMKCSNLARQSKAHTNESKPPLSSLLTKKNVGAEPSHVAYCQTNFNYLHPPENSLDTSKHKSPHTWFITFYAVDLLVPPTYDTFLRLPISHLQRAENSALGK